MVQRKVIFWAVQLKVERSKWVTTPSWLSLSSLSRTDLSPSPCGKVRPTCQLNTMFLMQRGLDAVKRPGSPWTHLSAFALSLFLNFTQDWRCYAAQRPSWLWREERIFEGSWKARGQFGDDLFCSRMLLSIQIGLSRQISAEVNPSLRFFLLCCAKSLSSHKSYLDDSSQFKKKNLPR